MKLMILLCTLLSASVSPLSPQSVSGRSGVEYENILARSDAAFFPQLAHFELTMKLYENNSYARYYQLDCFVKGDRKYLAVITDPPVVRRQSELRVDDVIWTYLASINRTYETSAKASFEASTFSEEDLLSSTLGYLYKLEKVEKVKLGGKEALELFLAARSDRNAYYRIDSYINEQTLLPIERDYYSFSDQKIKVEKFIEIRKKDNKLQYLHLVMYDSLIKGRYTDVVMQNFEYPNRLDDRMFTKRYMEIATQ